MSRAGRARREVLVRLAPKDRLVIDVGADHGHVAHALGGVATERWPHRIGRRDVRWVVADGLRPFRQAPAVVIAGMGALSIARILSEGPRPEVAILHAADDPPRLRLWLAGAGWRIEAEGLAPEAGRYAEIVRAVPGREASTGLALELGPRLLEEGDPHLVPWLRHQAAYFEKLAARTATAAPAAHAGFAARARFLGAAIAARQGSG